MLLDDEDPFMSALAFASIFSAWLRRLGEIAPGPVGLKKICLGHMLLLHRAALMAAIMSAAPRVRSVTRARL